MSFLVVGGQVQKKAMIKGIVKKKKSIKFWLLNSDKISQNPQLTMYGWEHQSYEFLKPLTSSYQGEKAS